MTETNNTTEPELPPLAEFPWELEGGASTPHVAERARQALHAGMPRELFTWGPSTPEVRNANNDALLGWEAEQRDKVKRRHSVRIAKISDRHRRSYAVGALADAEAELSHAARGTRERTLNDQSFKLGRYVNDGTLDREEVIDAMTRAAFACRWAQDDMAGDPQRVRAKIEHALDDQAETPNWDEIDWHTTNTAEAGTSGQDEATSSDATVRTTDDGGNDYSITLHRASDIRDAAPEWAWYYDGKGRLMRGTPVLFAGRPGTGKSTAARYFTAGYSRGTIEGCFHGTPVTVAYIAAEESVKYMVKPSLRAHNADMNRIVFPEVTLGGTVVKLLSVRDEQLLTERLLAANVSVVVVDPIMSTIAGRVDVHRTNETREQLEPWTRIAEKVNGLVIGIVHLRKQFGTDVIAAINASSAFGEISRGVLAFAQDVSDDDDGERVMSQEKNSAGTNDLALSYRIESVQVRTDDGQIARPGRFVLGPPSARRVADVLAAANTEERLGPVSLEVLEVVREHGAPVGPSQVAQQVEGLDHNTAGKYLRRLAKAGLLVKAARGLFDLPTNAKPRP